MKPQFFKSSRRSSVSSQRGIYIVFTSLLLVAIIAIVGLAVDIAMITMAQVKVRRAVDAAVTAGMSYRINKGWGYFRATSDHVSYPPPDLAKEHELVSIATEGVQMNLDPGNQPVFTENECGSNPAAMSWTCAVRNTTTSIRSAVSYNSWQDTIWVQADVVVPLFYSGFFKRTSICKGAFVGEPGNQFNNTGTDVCRIFGSNTPQGSQLGSARVGLVLDTSGSMNCNDSADPTCSCMNTSGGCPANQNSRIAQLRNAVTTFVERFNPVRDYISVVPYNIRAENPTGINPVATFWLRDANGQVRPFGEGAPRNFLFPGPPAATVSSGSRYEEIFKRIAYLRATGDTNTSDGLYAARKDFVLSGIPGNFPFTIVLFSDGAPTASTVRFAAPTGTMRIRLGMPTGILPDTAGDRDLVTQFVVHMPNTNPITIPAPSPLMRADTVTYGQIPGNTMIASDPDPNNGVYIPRCGSLHGEYSGYDMSMWAAPGYACLNNATYYKDRDYPYQAGVVNYPASYAGSTNGSDCSQVCNPSSIWGGNNDCLNCLNNANPSGGVGSGYDYSEYDAWQDFSAGVGGNQAGTPFYQVQRHYHATIDAADNIRRSGGSVIVVGLGPPGVPAYNGGSQATTDPYWRIWNDFDRKDPFLRRVAWDTFRMCRSVDPVFYRTLIPGTSQFRGYTGDVQLGCPANADPEIYVDGNDGRFIPLVTSNGLAAAFAQIATDLLLRLN